MSEDEVMLNVEEGTDKGKTKEEMPKRRQSVHSGEVLCYDENGDPIYVP